MSMTRGKDFAGAIGTSSADLRPLIIHEKRRRRFAIPSHYHPICTVVDTNVPVMPKGQS
jgi:hypothetical protein